MSTTLKNASRKPWIEFNFLIPALILFVVSTLIYLPTVQYEYVLDDKIVLTENDYVKKGFAGIKDILSGDSFEGYFGEKKDLLQGSRYRPFSIASFAIEHGIVGSPNSKISHGINILLYGLLVILIFQFLNHHFFKDKYFIHPFISLAFIAALVFALHPLHIEAVANVKGRDEILCLIFCILSLSSTWKFSVSNSWLYGILSFVLFFSAVMIKESALPFFLITPMFIWWKSEKEISKQFISFIPILLAIVVYFFIRISVIGYLIDPNGKEITDLLNNPFTDMSIGEKYATISYTLGRYLQLLVFPYPLTHDYYPYHIPKMNWSDWQVWLALIVNLGLVVLGIVGALKKKTQAFWIAFYFLSISIVSNVVASVGVFMNERFAFIPSLAFSALLVMAVHELSKKKSLRLVSLAPLIGVLVFYSWVNLDRIPDWKNGKSLNFSAIEVSENSARANCFYGVELYKEANETNNYKDKKALLAEAMTHMNKALEIYPTYGSALKMKAGILGAQYTSGSGIDRLLEEYMVLMKQNHIPYVDEFMAYLYRKTENRDRVIQFYHKLTHDHYLIKMNNPRLALSTLINVQKFTGDVPILMADLEKCKAVLRR